MDSAREAGKKVFVGMSGGVDSSVSAALLKEQGWDVTGVFIKVWQPDFLPCSWKEERLDAMRVCAALEIPFLFLDLEAEYKNGVVDYMIAEYRAGRTPNPDVMCNKHVKFGGFYDFAMANGADFVATGHYARVEIAANGTAKLLAGKDSNKDQSYFIWTIPQEKLKHVLFPVGDIEKPEVRNLARRFKLPTAEKKDSQGLCFVGKVDMQDFLAHFIKPKEGKVLDESGREIGIHPGAFFFTLGERRGFTVTEKTPNDAPYYVASKDSDANTITVSFKKSAALAEESRKSALIEKANWISGKQPEAAKKYLARSRYRQPLEECEIVKMKSDEILVTFEKPQETLTPGQSIVIYDGEECIGGGIIAG